MFVYLYYMRLKPKKTVYFFKSIKFYFSVTDNNAGRRTAQIDYRAKPTVWQSSTTTRSQWYIVHCRTDRLDQPVQDQHTAEPQHSKRRHQSSTANHSNTFTTGYNNRINSFRELAYNW